MEFRRVFQIPVSRMRHVEGHAWTVDDLPMPYGGDNLHPAGTELALFEDGRRLSPAYGRHAEIARDGGGRYSHWVRSLVFASGDSCPPDTNGRVYTAVYETPLDDAEEERLRALCDGIRLHRSWSADALQALARLREPAQRAYVFEWLGRSFIGARDPVQAVEQLVRAWHLGREPALGYLVDHMPGQGRTAELWGIFHRALIGARRRNDPRALCEAVVRHHLAVYAAYEAGLPSPGFQDPVLVDAATTVLGPLAPALPSRSAGRLRVGYLLAGEGGERYSPLPDISIDLAIAHDGTRVEPFVLTFHPLEALARESPFFAGRHDRLVAAGVPLCALPCEGSAFDVTRAAAEAVVALDLDVLVTNALSDRAFLLAAVRPARRVVGLGLGDIRLYTSKLLDSCVSFSDKPMEDTSCPVARAPSFISPVRVDIAALPFDLSSIGVPTGAQVVFSSGRGIKFRSTGFWTLVAGILDARADVHVVICGIDPAFLDEHPSTAPVAHVRDRIHALGWHPDYAAIMRTATLVIDTFPQGGGWSLCEAMSMEIPVIGSRDDVLSMFREEQWRPILTSLDLHGSVFDPTDVDGMIGRALVLLDDPEERRIAGRIARKSVEESFDLRPTSAAIEAEFERLFAES